MNNLEVIIGIEVHVVLNTKTKMFSRSLNSHYGLPNTLVNEIDLGLPGILPHPNPEAIKKGLWLVKALKATANYQNIQFDRKNYYYSDLPKGYQITQQYYPLAENGQITIETNQGTKNISVQRMHLEEDTAKQIVKNDAILLDYNRCGCPLIEIVTDPVISSAQEAAEYLKNLIRILRFNEISDAKLEDGSLRADVNISLRPYGQKSFNNKVEIKNINSINNVVKAINYEIQRQTAIILQDGTVEQETRRFDETSQTTIFMRHKSNATNYHYIHEPNIVTIQLTDSEYDAILKQKNKDLDELVLELQQFGLSQDNIELLLNDYELYKLYKELVNQTNLATLSFNWLSVDIMGWLKKLNYEYNHLTPTRLSSIAKMLILLNEQEINGKQAKVILEQLMTTNQDTMTIIQNNGFEQIKDINLLTQMIETFINQNPEMINQYVERPERVEKFLVGLVMKETKAQANPKITMDIIVKLLKKN